MTTPSPKKKKSIYIILLIVLAAVLSMVLLLGIWGQIQTRLSIGAAFGGAGFENLPMRTHHAAYDIEPQVIYRLDDNRYVELSNYEDCKPTGEDQWVAEAWYYDRNLGIKTELSTGMRSYQGRIINADPSGKNLIFPASSDRLNCSERGCGSSTIAYSTDYGRTLSYKRIGGSGTSSNPSEDSKEFTVVITKKELIYYNGEEGDYFFSRIELDGKTINGELVSHYDHVKTIPPYPVLMDHYQCDTSIKPKSVGRITVKEYDERRNSYVESLLSVVNGVISVLDKVESWQVTLRTNYAAYDIVPQVIYRLDDHRYVELSNYGGCLPTYEDEKVVELWYHDLRRNIKTRLFSKMRNYQGRVINADPSGKNLAFPVTPDRMTCEEELCGESMVYYSTDYGNTFKPFHFLTFRNGKDEATNPLMHSKQYTTIITNNELIVYEKYGRIYKVKKIVLNKENKNETPERIYSDEDSIPSYSVMMDSYFCDASIKPKSIGGISVEEYNRQRKGN
ncbi:T6SS immunity protein Tli3 family protein [Limnobaculum parvum]|uniref:Tli3-like domain-containing protein n=1 Tax=Limnobaculum parvum TaxID=2172103 RepID=A0A2Y9TWG8_9GAMM|nr:hypothetical protein [Limnobaculum parvum]AWH87890.1 hypothetical protein HYN51_04540 [Limnobaculum parvum]